MRNGKFTGFYAAARSTLIAGATAVPSATGTIPTAGTTTSVCGWFSPRLPLNLWPLFLWTLSL